MENTLSSVSISTALDGSTQASDLVSTNLRYTRDLSDSLTSLNPPSVTGHYESGGRDECVRQVAAEESVIKKNHR